MLALLMNKAVMDYQVVGDLCEQIDVDAKYIDPTINFKLRVNHINIKIDDS